MNRRQFLTVLAGTAGAAVLAPRFSPRGEAETDGLAHHATWIMGQIANIWVQGLSESQAQEAINAAFADMRAMEATWSSFRGDSELASVLSAPVGRSILVTPEFAAGLEAARSAWISTRGAFDPSVRPEGPAPGMDAFALEGSRLRRSSREASLDFGGIGCGLALDRAATVLRAHGVRQALLELSGDFLALGAPDGFAGWPLAAADPWTGEPTEAVFDLSHSALATSAVVERRSILDPRTGRVADHAAQATILAPNATLADAWSTAAVVAPLENLAFELATFDPAGRLLRA
jgi:thiamine biosynthesis lipoprotein